MGDNDLNILKESIKEVLSELGNNNSFRIEDYWNLEKLSPEQIQSLNTDLSVYLYGRNFGSPLYHENGKPVLDEIDEKHTCSFEEVKKELKTEFNFNDWQIVKKQGANGIKLILLFSNIRENRQIIIDEMLLLGWTKSYIAEDKIVNGVPVEAISFDPLYQDSIKDTVRQLKYLYHLSPTYNKESIMQNGLVPSSKNNKFDYPPRVHLLKPTITQRQLEFIGQQLCSMNTDPKNNGEYCLFKIDLENVPENVEFFFDPRYEGGIYTNQKIQSNAIQCISVIKLKKGIIYLLATTGIDSFPTILNF